MDVLSTVLAWLTPTSLGAAIGWLVNSKLRRTREVKESHDAFRQMYKDVSEELIKTRNENEKLYEAVKKLDRTMQHASGCDHWAICPIRHELHDYQTIGGEKLWDGANDGVSSHDDD